MKKILASILLLLSLAGIFLPSTTVFVQAAQVSVEVPDKPYKIVNVVKGVHVYWNDVDGVEKYGLWRSENGKNGTYKWIANPKDNHFTDIGVESGVTYYYKVSSMDPETAQHSEKSEPIGITYVATPDISERYNTAEGIELKWEAVDGAKGYAIYRKSYSGNDEWTRITTISNNTTFSWTDTSVAANNGTVYRYTIRALVGSDLKTLSGCRNTGRTMTRLTARTLNEAVEVDDTSVKCKWTTTSQASGYEVLFINEDGEETKFTVGNYKTGVKTFKNLESGIYFVQVRSYKKVTDVGTFYSAWSEELEVAVGVEPTPTATPKPTATPIPEELPVPAKPHNIVNVVSGVHVYWKAVGGVEKYGLWRSETGKDGTYKWVANPTVAHFTDTTVKSGVTYFYKVTTMDVDTKEHSEKSEPIGITYVTTPDISSRTNTAEGVKLEWKSVSGATGYGIYRKSYGGDDGWVRIATIEGNTTLSWTDTAVKEENGVAYRYTIRALTGSNLKTLSGCRNTGRTMVRLMDVVLNAPVWTEENLLDVSWVTMPEVSGYEVNLLEEDKVIKTVTLKDADDAGVLFENLTEDKEYGVQIRSFKTIADVGSFYSAWSEIKTTEDGEDPENPDDPDGSENTTVTDTEGYTYELIYDENGVMIEQKITAGDYVLGTNTLVYMGGKLATINMKDEAGNSLGTVQFYYNDNGTLKSEVVSVSSGTGRYVVSYDEETESAAFRAVEANCRQEYQYDTNGALSYYIVTETYPNGKVKEEAKYDSKGNRIYLNQYDKNGNLIIDLGDVEFN